MNETKDRRTFDRLIVPEITAFMINTNWYYLLRYKFFHSIAIFIFGKKSIQNLSVSGSCIMSKKNLKPGNAIHLIIHSPRENIIFIKGTVRWTSSVSGDNMHSTGIQFLAYGNRKKYNSYEVREQLHNFALQNPVLSER